MDEGCGRLERWKGMMFLAGAFSLAGTSVVAARLVQDYLGASTITAVSLGLAILFLLPWGWQALLGTVRGLTRRDWGQLLLQALLGIVMFRLFLLVGLQHTSTAEAGILTGAAPAITMGLACLLLKEPLDRMKLAGMGSTVAGILLIQGLFGSDTRFDIIHLAGNALVLCAAVCESLFNICSRAAAVKPAEHARPPLPPVVQTILVSALACALCGIPALFEAPWMSLGALTWKQWLALGWYGPVVTGLAFICWYAGITRCSASTAAAFSGLMPFTSLWLSAAILGESTGWQQWAGAGLVVLGMFFIGRDVSPRRKAENGNPAGADAGAGQAGSIS